MSFTSHGHHIPGTLKGNFTPSDVARCGGVNLCPRCKSEVESSMAFQVGEPIDYQARARKMVVQYVDKMYMASASGTNDLPTAYNVYVVWFTKTLKNWKCLLSTTIDDGMYYELTHDGDKGETYLDAYKHVENVVIPD